MKTLITNISLIKNGQTLDNQNLEITDTRITGFPAHPDKTAYDKVVDGKGMLAMPGLVNTHTHVAMTLFRSYADDMALMDWLQNKIWPVEANLNDDIVYWGSMLAFAEMIRGGTTAFCDMYMFMDSCAKAAEKAGMRGNIARGLSGVSPNAKEALAENVELFHKWNNACDGRIRVMLGPHAPYTCPPDYIKLVHEESVKNNISIHIHLAETRGEVDNCLKEYGKTPIELMKDLELFEQPTLAAHCVHLTDHDIEILAEKHVAVAHNPGSNLKLASGIAPVLKLRKAGVTVGLGTDGASSNNKLDMFAEMRLAALIHKAVSYDPMAITAPEALAMATVDGAKCLGYDDLGELKENYLADIVLVDRSGFNWKPDFNDTAELVYSGNSRDVDTVFINGQEVMHHKELLTIDVERMEAEVNRVIKVLYRK
jgi:5-methylthioadenosine/S-adenosylhomocysteine deaminase